MIEEIEKKIQFLKDQLHRTEGELLATIYNKEKLETLRMAMNNQVQILELIMKEDKELNKEKDSGTDSTNRTDGDTIKTS